MLLSLLRLTTKKQTLPHATTEGIERCSPGLKQGDVPVISTGIKTRKVLQESHRYSVILKKEKKVRGQRGN